MSFRVFCCALAGLLFSALLRADESVTVIKLSVQAQAAPTPALKYRLLPELQEMQMGNAVMAYYKCFMEQNHFYFDKEEVEKREKWQKCPLAELPDGLNDYGHGSLRQADYAARLDGCDWQILHQLRTEGMLLPLSDVQQLRMLAAALKVRYRGQVKAGKIDDAIRTHQTLFALARHLGEHPTLIGNLVGIAIANLAVEPFEELLQRPGCPNLYWALSQLPPSLVEIRKGMQGERFWVIAEFKDFLAPTQPWTAADVKRAVDKARVIAGLAGEADNKERDEWLAARLKDERWLADARRRLVAAGLPEASVAKFPPEQVLFRVLFSKYEITSDESTKWLNFPYWVAEAERERIKAGPAPDMEERIADLLRPAVAKVHRSQARLERRLALLRVVEALRLHAAAHDGQWPDDLKDINLPLPVDPFTGKPFTYKREGNTAIVQAGAPKGEEKNSAYNIRYEVTIKK
jgi:hypothetical protein